MIRDNRLNSNLSDGIGGLKIHDHICLIYKEKKDQMHAVAPFIGIGLKRNEKCLYIGDEIAPEQLVSVLSHEEIDAEAWLRSGALIFVSAKKMLLKQEYFNPKQMILLLERAVDDAKAEGYVALRIIIEMTSVISGKEATARQFIEYESKLGNFIANNDCVVVCQYSYRVFSPEIIVSAIKTHPVLIMDETAGDSPYYVPQEDFQNPGPEAELERLILEIKKRRHFENDLVKNADRFESMIRYSTNLFYVHDVNHVLTYISPQTQKYFDCSPEEALVKWTEFATDNPINQKGYESTQRAIDTGQAQPPFELELVGKKGRKIWVQANEAPVVKKGNTLAIIGALTDITQRKNIEDLFKEREHILAEAQEIFKFGTWKFDFKKQTIIWQEETYRIYGVSPQDFVPTIDFFIDLIHPEDRQIIENWIKSTYSHEEMQPVDFRIIRQNDKQLRHVTGNGKTFFDSLGNPDYVIGVVQDITERKEAEEALREAEEKYRKLIDTANDPIFVADASSGIIIGTNQAAQRLLGKPEKEIVGMEQWQLHPKEEAERYSEIYKNAIKAGRGIIGDMYIVDKGGSKIPVEISASVTEIGGKKIFQGIFRDITERKLAEEALREKDRDIKNAYVDVFSAVTGGKLVIMTAEEIISRLGEPLMNLSHVISGEQLASARLATRQTISGYLPDERLENLIIAFGEAITNALKHAVSGDFQTFKTAKKVQVLIKDSGPGIDFNDLPKATLLPGFSTKQTLGMGFSFMLEFCDRVLLATQPGGTSIVLEIDILKI